MSVDDNVRAVEAIFDAFGRGDIPYILDQLTDDVHWVAHLDSSVPWSGDYSGKANVPNFFQALGGSVEVSSHPVNQLVAQDDTVVAMGDVSFSVRSTGKASSSSWVYVMKLRDGKVYSYDQFNDPGLAQAFA
jgi:ketosteroid isomerase-like protein